MVPQELWEHGMGGQALRQGTESRSPGGFLERTVPGRFCAGQGGQCTAENIGKVTEEEIGGVTCEDGSTALCPVWRRPRGQGRNYDTYLPLHLGRKTDP